MKYHNEKLIVYVLVILVMMSTAMADTPTSTRHDFRTVAEKHIQAIKSRDLDKLLSTVTEGENLTLIFPNGTTLYTRQEYVDFHIKWFADESWTIEIEPISFTVHDNYGVVLVRTTYTDNIGARQAMLAMSFVLESGSWRLVFDQNTRISEE